MRGEGLRVEKYGSDGAELWFPDGTSLPVGHYSGEYQLHWRLQGCPRGTPHLRVATSTTVRDPCVCGVPSVCTVRRHGGSRACVCYQPVS